MDDHDGRSTRLGPDSGGHASRREADRPRLQLGVGPRGGPPAGAAVDRHLPARLRRAAARPAAVPRVPRLGSLLFAGGRARVPDQVGVERGTARCTPARSSPRWRCPGLIEAAIGRRPRRAWARSASASRSCSSRRCGRHAAAGSAGRPGSAACSRSSAAPSMADARRSADLVAPDRPRRLLGVVR